MSGATHVDPPTRLHGGESNSSTSFTITVNLAGKPYNPEGLTELPESFRYPLRQLFRTCVASVLNESERFLG
jgi:hypothetical protein